MTNCIFTYQFYTTACSKYSVYSIDNQPVIKWQNYFRAVNVLWRVATGYKKYNLLIIRYLPLHAVKFAFHKNHESLHAVKPYTKYLIIKHLQDVKVATARFCAVLHAVTSAPLYLLHEITATTPL